MNKIAKIKNAIPICFFAMLLPLQALAYIYDYNLTGYYNAGGDQNNVSGIVSISDSFIFQNESPSSQPFFYFQIASFSINVDGPKGSYVFSGDKNNRPELPADMQDNGVLVWNVSSAINSIVKPMPYEKQWYFYNAQDVWNNVYHVVNFYDDEMKWYEPIYVDDGHFGMLAPYIELGAPLTISQLEPGQQPEGGKFWLERTPAPVPEPCSILLLSAAIGGLGLVRKRIRRMSAACKEFRGQHT